MAHHPRQIPLWLKVLYTLYVSAVVWVYRNEYGPANFLWFSDIALLATVAALWIESSLLASMMAVAILLPEIAWTIIFLLRLVLGIRLGDVTGYMFDAQYPLGVRALSLFHLFLPVLLLWMIHRLGYDRRAWRAQTLVAWIIFPATYWLTKPAQNINWVFGPGGGPQHVMPPLLYLLLVPMVLFPLGLYLPTHWALLKLFPCPNRRLIA